MTVVGEVRTMSLRPRVDVPALDVELWDGSGALHLVWLGRRSIPGISPGIRRASHPISVSPAHLASSGS